MELLATLLQKIIGAFIALGVVISTFLGGPHVAVTSSPTQQATTTVIAMSTVAKSQGAGQKSGTISVSTNISQPRRSSDEVGAPTKASEEQVNEETRAALVNILCISQGGGVGSISGSGVVIDSRGVILTNAHIGQYFLLRDYPTANNVDCTIRVGSPAARLYRATLLYLPPSWINANAQEIIAQQATGTGENDYSLLLINSTTDPAGVLPTSFPALTIDTTPVKIGESMLLASYPAGFLSGELIEKSLYQSSAVAYVTQFFSFDSANRLDLFSIGGTVVSQAGSSGGAAVHLSDGTLAGIIATATVGTVTSERDLRAVTITHINASLAAGGMGGIAAILAGDLSAKAAVFNAGEGNQERNALQYYLNH